MAVITEKESNAANKRFRNGLFSKKKPLSNTLFKKTSTIILHTKSIIIPHVFIGK
jgi:hypothetical protein